MNMNSIGYGDTAAGFGEVFNGKRGHLVARPLGHQ